MATSDLAVEIRRFAADHPEGWDHHQWMGLLHDLSQSGHDVGDGDAIGLALESERLAQVLKRIDLKGLGPKRIDALAGHFGTLWNIMSASADDLAALPNISRPLAQQILEVLQ